MGSQPLRSSLGVKIWSSVSERGYDGIAETTNNGIVVKRNIDDGTATCGPGLTRFFRNDINSVLRQDQTQEGTSLLAFKIVTEKTCLSGWSERSRPSGVIYSAASPIREVIYLETFVEKQEN